MSILDNMNLFGPAAEQLMAQQRAKMDVTRDLAEKHGAKLPYMAAQFAPGMGVQDAAGENPGLPPTGSELVDIFAAPNDPSMRENIQAGGPLNYLMAAGQGLGVLGDAMYAAPLVGVALGPTVGTALKGTGMAVKGAAKAAKGIASIPPRAEPKDMVFVHNTSEEAIKSFDNMGGIPSPSIAVTKADQPFSGFGQIQLIGKPEKFDPAIDPRNKIYSSDAYTPRAPKKLRLAKDDAVRRFEEDYSDFINKLEGMDDSKLDDYFFEREIGRYDTGVDALANLGKNNFHYPENRIDELERFFDSDIPKMKFFDEIGRDPLDVTDFSKPFPQKKYNKWVREQENKYLDQEGVFQYFDDFEETTKTVPYTLDNVVNNMVQETQRGGEKGLGMVGANRLQALMAEEFSDLPGIKTQKGRISRRDSATSYVDIEDDIYQSLIKNIDEMKFKPHELNNTDLVSGDAMYAAEKLQEAVGENLKSGMNIEKAIKAAYTDQAYYLDLPEMMPKVVYDDMQKSFTANAIRPVEYFEAKPTRAVGFDEFAGAIVGEGTSKEVIDILEKRGLKVIKQSMDDLSKDFGKNKARQAFKEQFFSVAPIAAAAGAMTMQEEEDRGIGSL